MSGGVGGNGDNRSPRWPIRPSDEAGRQDSSTARTRLLLVSGVPLLGLAEVRTVVTADASHRVHGVVERLAVATEVAPAPLAVGVAVDDVKRAFRADVAVAPVDVQRLAVGTFECVHTYA